MSNKSKLVKDRNYHKANFDQALRKVVPYIYYEEDEILNQKQIDVFDQIINTQLDVINNIDSILYVSAVSGTVFSSIDSPQGISQFFIKQNGLMDLDCNDFERRILLKVGSSYRDFETSSDFSNYLTNTLLPRIRTNSPTLDFVGNNSVSANHNYLINNLSWLYFLNRNDSLTYNPSSFVHDLLVEKIYPGGNIQLNDAMRGLTTYLWKNYDTKPTWQALDLIPSDFKLPAAPDAYTSGTQQLDKLLTLVDILYSPLFTDMSDTRVKDAIDDYLINGYKLDKKINTGSFINLVKAFSFAFADYNDSVDKLEVLNDINLCPDELLPKLAEIIGWRLFGSEPDRWRLQIANAIDIYRQVGTKKSLQVAVDSVLGQDVFNVSSSINELWESYVPNLIYYALATESRLLESFNTWTRGVATSIGIPYYSTSSMDENIRICVDEIIHQTCTSFRRNFFLGGKLFQVGSESFKFNYRNRDMDIPPFEEYPYYLNVRVTEDMVDFIVDKLVCFGVRQEFAFQVGDYIKENVTRTVDDIAISNGWLFFTSGAQYPPNWNLIIKDISNTKSEYFPLWNGKSSHFKILLETSSFDFTKTSLEADSAETVKLVSKTAQEFSPAHSIPDVILLINDQDSYLNCSNAVFNYVGIDKVEQVGLLTASSDGFSMYGSKTFITPTYKRGLTATSLNSFSRSNTDSLIDPLLGVDQSIAYLPRRAHRRRNFKNVIPKDGFYDRTGFNMPASLQDYSVQNDQFLPLGLIPSSLKYVSIPDYNNIPAVYDICENLNSSSIYNGVSVSNTYPVRGWNPNFDTFTQEIFQVSKANDRGQLHPFVATIHHIGEQAKLLNASAYYHNNYSEYNINYNWKNVLQSYANSSTELSGAFPNSFDDYINFKLGRDFHKLYYDYTHNFNTHRTSHLVTTQDGPIIVAHALGSLLYNSDLSKRGSFGNGFITTNLANTIELRNKERIFSNSGTASGTYIASSILNVGLRQKEYRNSGILEHVEFCQVSATSKNNNFVILDIDPSFKSSIRKNPLLDNNVLIKQSAYDGFGRVTFDISKYSLDSNLYDVTRNFLSPNHEFNFKFKSIVSDSVGASFGGGTVGVWIHTKPELGKVWSFTKNNEWVQHSASAITIDEVIDHSHLFTFLREDRVYSSGCISYLDPTNPNRRNEVIASISDKDFKEISINFHTRNHTCIDTPNTVVTPEYFEGVSNHVHRLNQNYVIEVFTIPTQDDKFSLYYNFSMLDLTLNKWSKPLITGIPNGSNMGDIYCKEFRVDLSKHQILNIIKYFNQLRGDYSKQGYNGINNFTGYASRVATVTQGFYETSGGSRLNYNEDSSWLATGAVNGYGLIEEVTLIN
jgi:hypothetical protein